MASKVVIKKPLQFKSFEFIGRRDWKRWRAPRVVSPEGIKEAISVGMTSLSAYQSDRFDYDARNAAQAVQRYLQNVKVLFHVKRPDIALDFEDSVDDTIHRIQAEMDAVVANRPSLGLPIRMNNRTKAKAGG